MFDIDRWLEIFSSIRKNLLRTILSGFTISLGLFIFIVLFGIGNGLQNGFMSQFIDDATNVIFISTGITEKPYAGLQEGRQIEFKNEDFEYINEEFEEGIDYSTVRIYDNVTARHKGESGNYSVRAVSPDHQYLEKTKVYQGRYINQSDLNNEEKYVVIGRLVKKDLYKNEEALGKYIELDGLNFKIIGVFSDDGGDNEERMIYMPYTTNQLLHKNSQNIDQINLGYNVQMTPEEAIGLGEDIEKKIKQRKDVAPDDESGIRVNNFAENMKDTFAFVFVLLAIVTIIAAGTLFAGVLGISNIMVYIVKERTKEIGIRKALGAKPKSIVALILQETIVVTFLAGLLGVVLGILALQSIGDSLEEYFILNPSVGWGMIIFAAFCLVLAGAIAGFIPAYRASRIKPIEALRSE